MSQVYKVTVKRVVEEVVTIKASSEQAAKDKIMEGDYNDDQVHAVDTYDVEIVKVTKN